MGSGARVLRPLDPVERYFWLLDQVTPTNAVVVAECDRPLDPEQLQAGLHLLQTRHPLLGAYVDRTDGVPTFVATDQPPDVTVVEGVGRVDDRVERAYDTPMRPGPQPLLRAEYLPDGERSTLLVAFNHAIADGRSSLLTVQRLLQWVEGGDAVLPPAFPLPPPLNEQFPEGLGQARAAAEVLAAMRSERAALGPPAAFPFHRPDAGRRVSHLEWISLDPAERSRLREAGRAAGASGGAMLSAAALQAAAELFDDPAERVLMLTSPTDLGRRVVPPMPTECMRVAVGLLTTPYAVRAEEETAALAARVTEQTRRELERGESHLFFRIARIAAYQATDDGLASFATWMGSLPQNVTASNVGAADHVEDPEWLRRLTVSLAPSPNQVAFVATNTYRDEMLVSCVTDSARFPEPLAERYLEGLIRRVGGRRVQGG